MPTNKEFDENKVDELISTGGLARKTLHSKKLHEGHFENFLTQNQKKLDDLLKNENDLQEIWL